MRRATFGHFFLTSKPYFGLDNDNFLQTDFTIQSGRLSYQPSTFESMQAQSTFQTLDVYGGGKAFSVYPEDWLQATASFQTLDVYGGGITFSTEPESIQAQAQFLDLNVYGNGITYNIAPESMQATANFQTIDVF